MTVTIEIIKYIQYLKYLFTSTILHKNVLIPPTINLLLFILEPILIAESSRYRLKLFRDYPNYKRKNAQKGLKTTPNFRYKRAAKNHTNDNLIYDAAKT